MLKPSEKEINYYQNRVVISGYIEGREEAEFLSVSEDDDVTDLCWNTKLLNARYRKEKEKESA